MAKKILQKRPELSERPQYPDEVGTLGYIGKMKVLDCGESAILLSINPKANRIFEAKRKKDADLAEFCLEQLGFETIYNWVKDGEETGLVAADMVFEYDINAKPYTITNAKPKEMKSLQDLIQYAGAKVKVKREFINSEGRSVEEKVTTAEFKRAIANYLAQHQM